MHRPDTQELSKLGKHILVLYSEGCGKPVKNLNGTEEILWLDSREGIGGMDPGAKENNYDFMVSVSGRGDDMQD